MNENTRNPNCGIEMIDCEDSIVSNNTIIDYESGIRNVRGKNNNFTGNIISKNDNIFTQMIDTVERSNIENQQEILAAINDMKSNQDTDGFKSAYKKFMSLAADHTTLLSTFIPALLGLLK